MDNLSYLPVKNVCCEVSVEPSHRNGYNEGSQRMFEQ